MSANNNNNIFDAAKIALKGGDYSVINKDASVKTIVESYNPFFLNYFSDKKRAEQAMTIALDVTMDDKFSNCNKHSIVKAIIDTYRLGLNPTPGIDHTYLVPYKGNIKLMVSHKGFTSLLFKAGWIVETFPVYKCDEFTHKINENGQQIHFVQNWDERNVGNKDWVYKNLHAVYLIAKHTSGLTKSLVVYKSEIEKLRLVSPSQTYANPKFSSKEKIQKVASKLPVDVWEDWYEEMSLAKSIKKLAKQLPLGEDTMSSIVKLATNLDDYAEINDDTNYQNTLKQMGDDVVIDEVKGKTQDKPKQQKKLTSLQKLKNHLNSLELKILNEGKNGNKYFVSINKINGDKLQNLLNYIETSKLGYKSRQNDILIVLTKGEK